MNQERNGKRLHLREIQAYNKLMTNDSIDDGNDDDDDNDDDDNDDDDDVSLCEIPPTSSKLSRVE